MFYQSIQLYLYSIFQRNQMQVIDKKDDFETKVKNNKQWVVKMIKYT